jgi:hypothetical protein
MRMHHDRSGTIRCRRASQASLGRAYRRLATAPRAGEPGGSDAEVGARSEAVAGTVSLGTSARQASVSIALGRLGSERSASGSVVPGGEGGPGAGGGLGEAAGARGGPGLVRQRGSGAVSPPALGKEAVAVTGAGAAVGTSAAGSGPAGASGSGGVGAAPGARTSLSSAPERTASSFSGAQPSVAPESTLSAGLSPTAGPPLRGRNPVRREGARSADGKE